MLARVFDIATHSSRWRVPDPIGCKNLLAEPLRLYNPKPSSRLYVRSEARRQRGDRARSGAELGDLAASCRQRDSIRVGAARFTSQLLAIHTSSRRRLPVRCLNSRSSLLSLFAVVLPIAACSDAANVAPTASESPPL